MLIVLHGQDSYRSLQALEDIKEKFKREVDPTGSNIVVFDGDSEDSERLHNALFASSFFARRRLIVLKNILHASVALREVVEKALEVSPDGGEHIVVFWEDAKIGEAAKRKKMKTPRKKSTESVSGKKLEEMLLAVPYAKYFGEMTRVEALRWIAEECNRINTAIVPDASEELYRRVGTDTWRLANELHKLSAISSQHISKQAVAAHVPLAVEDRIFDVIDAIFRGDTSGSMRAAERMVEGGMAFQEFFAVLIFQLRNVWEVKSGVARPDLHPFARKKALDISKRFSENQMKEMIAVLVRIDQESKTSAQSSLLLVDRLISHLSRITGKPAL